ncbi:MAG: FhaA domain-containing protein [Armatimonadota bacterium]
MAFLRRLEDTLASVIDGGLARLDGGGVHPLEIARRLQTEMAENRLLGMDVPYAPNRFTVSLGERDFAHFGELADEIGEQIARSLEDYASEHGWAFGDRVQVSIVPGGREGRIAVEHTLDEDAPGARLQVMGGVAGGGTFEVGQSAVIGRDPSCEVVLDEAAVSRRHAEIEWTYQGYVIRDLGSSNGTFVNTAEIDEALLSEDDLIEVGLVQMRFRGPGW